MVRRAKRGKLPKNPSTIGEIPVPFPEDFSANIIYDNESPTNRIVIFASLQGLKLLDTASTWYMDGTFSTAPSQFRQLFVIRVPLGENCASAIYALLPSKQQDAYEEMMTALLDVCLTQDIRPHPVHIVTDYEMAIHNAVRSVFHSSIHIQVCIE